MRNYNLYSCACTNIFKIKGHIKIILNVNKNNGRSGDQHRWIY